MEKIKTIIIAVVSLCLILSFTSKKEIEDKVYEFKILAKSENEYITLFEVDGQRFVYIYEGSLQKLD